MGGQSQSTTQQIPPQIQQGMNSLPSDVAAKLQGLQPQYMTDPFTGQRKVDPLSYSDPNNMPDPLIEALKWIVGASNDTKSASKRK